METIRLEQVLAEVKLLSQEEQQQLRDTLDRWLRHEAASSCTRRPVAAEAALQETRLL